MEYSYHMQHFQGTLRAIERAAKRWIKGAAYSCHMQPFQGTLRAIERAARTLIKVSLYLSFIH